MGEIVKALGAIKQAKAAIGSNGADTSDPGVQLAPINLPGSDLSMTGGIMAQAPDQSAPSPGIGLMDLIGSSVQPQDQSAPAPQTSVDNPYTSADNLQNPASDIGTQDDTPITVQGDGWKPPHKEGWLGKTMDVLEMLHGRGTPFKNRVDEKNLEAAMRGFQSHPEEAINRVAQVSPDAATKLKQTMSAVQANDALAQQRQDELNQGRQAQLQSQVSAVVNSNNPEQVYAKVLPVLNAQAERLGMPAFSDKYDPDTLGVIAKSGMTPYQQGALSHEQKSLAAQISNQNVDNQIAKQRLIVEKQNADTSRMNAETDRQNANRKEDKPVTKNIFHQDGSFAGSVGPDGMTAVIYGPDGKPYAFVLRKKGDINSRVRAPENDAVVQAAAEKAAGN